MHSTWTLFSTAISPLLLLSGMGLILLGNINRLGHLKNDEAATPCRVRILRISIIITLAAVAVVLLLVEFLIICTFSIGLSSDGTALAVATGLISVALLFMITSVKLQVGYHPPETPLFI